ncbi:hypothetical protein CCH79_00015210 [Gambusia affinis]|uniref:Contactin-1 n=1 Tax=Gambusia affinis TaxID=33528 RepID=A0A315VUM5_GAMAF|nr:hypothetical protein CCH79_00015210 [Gambusia affinis]
MQGRRSCASQTGKGVMEMMKTDGYIVKEVEEKTAKWKSDRLGFNFNSYHAMVGIGEPKEAQSSSAGWFMMTRYTWFGRTFNGDFNQVMCRAQLVSRCAAVFATVVFIHLEKNALPLGSFPASFCHEITILLLVLPLGNLKPGRRSPPGLPDHRRKQCLLLGLCSEQLTHLSQRKAQIQLFQMLSDSNPSPCAAPLPGDDEWKRESVNGTHSHTIKGLKPGTSYSVRVVARDGAGPAVHKTKEVSVTVPDFLIEYMDLLHQPGVWVNLTEVSGTTTTAQLQLSPYVYYTFRVLAQNDVGYSDPSNPSAQYRTNPSAPDENPTNVEGAGTESDNLVISWKPLTGFQSNGPGLQYKVQWRQKDVEDDWTSKNVVNDSQLIVSGTPTYVAYEIKVQAFNNYGNAPEPTVVIGYSGEDTSRSLFLTARWQKFSGNRYQIPLSEVYYRRVRGQQDQQEEADEQEQILTFSGNRSEGMLPGLQPYSVYDLFIKVFNNKGEGPPSPKKTFETPEGVPDLPSFLSVTDHGLDTLTVKWGPPLSNNGRLTGYTLKYHPVNTTSELGPVKEVTFPANVTAITLTSLNSSMLYKFYLKARTRKGPGPEITEEASTAMDTALIQPTIQPGKGPTEPPHPTSPITLSLHPPLHKDPMLKLSLLTIMASTPLLLLGLFSSVSVTLAVLFGEPRIYGEDATGYGPIFEEEPMDVVYTDDSPDKRISMNCRARANPPATYRWRRDNWEIKLMEQPDEHYSLVGGNLVITNPIQKKHAGTYTCVARNIYGTVLSKEARIKFGYIEEFPDEEREPVYVKEGQGAVLLCVPPKAWPQEVSYRWIFNEFPVFLPTDRRRFVSQKTGNLYIAKVEAQDAGNYSCFVSSPIIGKSVYSKFIPLIPLPPEDGEERKYPADIRVKFPVTTAMLASNITLECFALGNPIPHIVWRKVDATDLPANHEISESGAALHLYNVQYEDAGSYECEAINTKGKDWHKNWLYVECKSTAPEWAETINNTQVDIGSEHTMRCVASGKPFPFIRWYKDGYMYGKGELKFSSLTFDDSGMYQCIAENYRGIKYANAELRVVAWAPTFELNPVKKYLLGARDRRVVIECKPRAAPKPRFTWTKGKELLFNSSRVSVMFDGSLEIRNATKNDEGLYTCFAENDRGKADSSGYLTITEATSITVAPEDSEVRVGDEVILHCAASYDPMLDITFIWAIDFRVIDFNAEWPHYERVMSEDGVGDLRIKNAQIWHEGRYTCTAQTVVDDDTAYADLKVVGVPGPPGVLRIEEIGDTWVKLLWSKPAEHNSPILYYTVQTRHFWALNEDDWRNASTSPSFLDGTLEKADVTDLYPWMEYQFRIIATNEYGSGEASIPSLKIKTWDAPPVVSPTDIAGYGGRNGEIVITWNPVQPWYFYGKKFGYIVALKPHNAYDWFYETISDPETRRHVHRDSYFIPTDEDFLVREFQVKIKSFNVKGDGPYSLTKVIYYPRDVPIEPPTDVYARPVSSTEAVVWWLPIVDTGTGLQQYIEGYQIKYWRKYDDPEPGANRIFVPATVNQTRLENMLPDSHYLIEVRAFNGAGLGPPGEHCEMFTKRPPPSEPPRMWRYVTWTGQWLYVWWDHIQYDWFGNVSFPLYYKVMFRKTGYIYGKVYITGWHFMDFPMPQLGDYELMVRGRYEGGDGPVRMISIKGKASLTTPTISFLSLLLLALCITGLHRIPNTQQKIRLSTLSHTLTGVHHYSVAPPYEAISGSWGEGMRKNMEREIDRWIGSATPVMQYQSAVVKRELTL